MIKDSLGERMKSYEFQYSQQTLLPLIPVICRCDGRAFHTFTADLARPYDIGLSTLMIDTTKYLVKSTGAIIGYVQSDEISLIWLAEDSITEIFFGGNVLKMTSILASETSAFFNKQLKSYLPAKAAQYSGRDDSPAFDARVWNVPTRWEATNYLIWREMDATRNSLTMAAQAYYSHNQLHGKGGAEKHDMLHAVGVNWNDYPDHFKRGTYIQRMAVERAFSCEEMERLPPKHAARLNPLLTVKRQDVGVRELPPLAKIVNRSAVIFDGAEPILKVEE